MMLHAPPVGQTVRICCQSVQVRRSVGAQVAVKARDQKIGADCLAESIDHQSRLQAQRIRANRSLHAVYAIQLYYKSKVSHDYRAKAMTLR